MLRRPSFRRFALVAAFLAGMGQAATAVAHGEAHEHAAEHHASHQVATSGAATISNSAHDADVPRLDSAAPHESHTHGNLGSALKSRADGDAALPTRTLTMPAATIRGIDLPPPDATAETPPDPAARRSTHSRAPPRV
ncbi:MAG: hypothetical protein C0503_04265 [Gemmatimonas sp.]|nr:hypothetical protein [Gemmatimonas sp.]